MRKIFHGAVYCVALLVGCSIASGDAIDNFAKSLQALAEQEENGGYKGRSGTRKPHKVDKPTGKVKKIDPFYAMSKEERIQNLTDRWDRIKTLSKKEQSLLKKQTFETTLLTVRDVLKDGIGTIRGFIVVALPNFVLAKARVEDLADSVFLFGYLMTKLCDKKYRENLHKLYWISTCLLKAEQNRSEFVDKVSGENKCAKYGCVKSKKCIAVFLGYGSRAFEPWVDVSVTGIDTDGRHIDGLVGIVVKVAVPGSDPTSMRIVNDFQSFSRVLVLIMNLFKSIQTGMAREMGREL